MKVPDADKLEKVQKEKAEAQATGSQKKSGATKRK